MRRSRALLVILILLTTIFMPVLAVNDYGEDEDYLGQVVDDYENDDNVSSMTNVINNSTLDCMELEYDTIDKENFTTYTEVDVPDHLTIIASKVTWAAQIRNEDTRAWKDYTANYFGDFEFDFVLEYTDVEAGDLSSQAVGLPIVLSNSNGDFDAIWASSSVMVYGSQNTDNDDQMQYSVVSRSGGGSDGVNTSIAYAIAKYYCKFTRVGALLTADFYSDADRLNLVFQLTTACTEDTLRYIQVAVSRNAATDPNDHTSGYIENLNILSPSKMGYQNGHYYTEEMLDGDIGLVLMYNDSIPAKTKIKMEFSTNNSTWVDHNNVGGSDTLITGFECLDLRDLNTTSLYMRVNMTSTDISVTPRIYQLRLVTITDVELGEGDTIIMGGSGIFWIILIIVVPLVAYMVNKK